MTKREFFEARAKADYLKRHGAIQCPPAAADGSAPMTRFRHRHHRGAQRTAHMTTPRLYAVPVFTTFVSPIRKEDEPDAS